MTDDSIIEDENTLIERGLKLYKENVISLDTFMTKYLHYDEVQVKEEKAQLLKNIAVVIELLDAEVIDKEKAIALLLEDLPEEEKARILANTGEVYTETLEEELEEELE